MIPANKNILPGNNIALASIFHRMADCYRYLGKDERFRAIAYENVSKILHNMKEDIAGYAIDVKSLDAIGRIGESIAEKIIEYLHTGKIKTFEKLKKQVPFELLELMDITTIGPATLKTLHDELHIKNKDELKAAIESGRLNKLKGFANKKIENISKSLKLIKVQQRLPLQEAEKIAEELIVEIRKIAGVQKAEIAGSLRRKKETIGDIDIIILAEFKYRKKIVARFISLPLVKKVLAKGLTKASVILKYKNVQADIRLVHDYELGAAMLYFTGSKEHNVKLRTISKQRGYKINEYGIFDAVTNKRLAGKTEEEMYHFLNMKYIPPEQRLDNGEIEKAVMK
jgi:DNA polymerase (family 10)